MTTSVAPRQSDGQSTGANLKVLFCWIFSAGVILLGLAGAISPQSWLNDRVAGALYMAGGALLLPPVLRRLRVRYPLVRPSIVPLIFGALLIPISLAIAEPFKPSASEQAALREAAITDAKAHLAKGNATAARMALTKFSVSRDKDREIDALLTAIDASKAPANSPDQSKAAAALTKTPPPPVMQDPASAYAERIETYWLPEVGALPDAPPADDEAFGKLLTQIDGLVVNVEDGADLELSPKQKLLRSQLMQELGSKQASLLPAMRRRYSEALDEKLFRRDVRVTVSGTTLKLVGGMFVRNANVEDTQTVLAPVVNRLRFRRVEYRWNPQIGDSLYYDLQPPSDRAVARWDGTGFVTATD
ncbi:hypothetical protein [Blastomonas sp.]|uniref:hypothetical protein n=1 Tax=Blastomonas sp. TaxID=1909299 RepID=UPI002628B1DE|nr:hypothetical protein [Blastomonas sp.]MDM7956006.1 hypothetical protein [Blastomonas sp.]